MDTYLSVRDRKPRDSNHEAVALVKDLAADKTFTCWNLKGLLPSRRKILNCLVVQLHLMCNANRQCCVAVEGNRVELLLLLQERHVDLPNVSG